MWRCVAVARALESANINPLELYHQPLSDLIELEAIASVINDPEVTKTIEARAKARAEHERKRELNNG
jgi:hypothetical protein